MSIIRLKNHHVEDDDDYDSDSYGNADEKEELLMVIKMWRRREGISMVTVLSDIFLWKAHPQVGHLPPSVQLIKLVIYNVGGRKE